MQDCDRWEDASGVLVSNGWRWQILGGHQAEKACAMATTWVIADASHLHNIDRFFSH
jgi:hypothetical protein